MHSVFNHKKKRKETPLPGLLREVTLAVGMHLKKPLFPPLPVTGGHPFHLLKATEEGRAMPRDESWAPARFEN